MGNSQTRANATRANATRANIGRANAAKENVGRARNNVKYDVYVKKATLLIAQIKDITTRAVRIVEVAKRKIEEIEALARAPGLDFHNKMIKENRAVIEMKAIVKEVFIAASDAKDAVHDATEVKNVILSTIDELEVKLKEKEQLLRNTHEAKEAAVKALREAGNSVLHEENRVNKLSRKNSKIFNTLQKLRVNMKKYMQKVEDITNEEDNIDQHIKQIDDRIVVLDKLYHTLYDRIADAKKTSNLSFDAGKAANQAEKAAKVRINNAFRDDAERAARAEETKRARAEETKRARAEETRVEEARAESVNIIEEAKHDTVRSYTRTVEEQNHSLEGMREFLNGYFTREGLAPDVSQNTLDKLDGIPENWDDMLTLPYDKLYKKLRHGARSSHPDTVNRFVSDPEIRGILLGVNIAISSYMQYMKNTKSGGTRHTQYANKSRFYKRFHTYKTDRK